MEANEIRKEAGEAERFREIEDKWAKRWEEGKIFEADIDEKKKKVFVTFPFPYMNGPLHIGHGFTSARVDVFARFKRMQGCNVLFPWAWHLTGEPITGAAGRLKRGDAAQIKIFREMDRVPEDELKRFVDPEYIARYYIKESKDMVKAFCHGIDWRREFYTTSLHPAFSKFIEWQYLTLKEKNYVIKGTHPVVWCPHDKSPTGDHDRLQGEGASPVEYILLKFSFNGAFIVAATLRPETIFGVTNMWVAPDSTLVEVKVEGESWIMAKEAFPKISEQHDNAEIAREFSAREIVGKYCREPLHGRETIILPATFVNPDSASGIVMSVPSHAPYDWLGLKDLIENPAELEKFGIAHEKVKSLKPISLIKAPGFGEHPAIEICNQMGIANQKDEKAEKATEIIYKEEFYKGTLKENTGKYAGYKVNEVKKELVKELEEKRIASKMWELSEKVVCRCGNPCVVKILKDQWFLDYGNAEWKEKVREALKGVKLSPEEARANFENTISWLEAKACARRSGMGTPLPWDREWIVETLSDSTVYMAFYTIAKEINENKIDASSLNKDVFDFIFYNLRSADEISKKYSIDKKILLKMQREFSYFMPVDLRVSAKELIPNHLSFFVFQHVALFNKEKWPRYIGVNGMISIEGEKMSKSKGNFVTLKDAIKTYSASCTRAALLYSAESMRDPDWRAKSAVEMLSKLNSFYELCLDITKNKNSALSKQSSIQKWLDSRMQKHIENATASLENLNTRTAFQSAFFDIFNDVKWYMRRSEEINYSFLYEILGIWLRLLSPFIPAICEELWEKAGKKGFISLAEFPKPEPQLASEESENAEEMVTGTAEDIKNIIKVTAIEPKKIHIYASPKWKWKVYSKMAEIKNSGKKAEMKEIMKELLKDEELKKEKELAGYVSGILKTLNEMKFYSAFDDEKALKEAKDFFEKEFKCAVNVYGEKDDAHDPLNKRKASSPGRAAIYIE